MPKRPKDSSTDSIEISTLRESRTQAYQRTISQAPPGMEGFDEVEANVIVIAHPEDQMLGSRFRLRPGSVLEIGRSPAAEISLPEVLSISRAHARLEHQASRVLVEDLGSTNGTYVNDRPIDGPTVLHSGDRFQVGAVHFKFLHERDVENAYHLAIYTLVMRDGLTETYNRRKFTEEIEREVRRALRYERPLTLIMLDLDHFKSINDNYGHLCGDFVLKMVALRCSELLRSEQVFARVGGEEFAVICPEMPLDNATQLAEKLRERVAREAVNYAGFEVSVTASFGVAELGAEMKDHDGFFDAADRALYEAKSGGRDRVVVYDQ